MQGRRKSCVSGRPGRLRTRSYTSLTYTYLTLPYLGCRIDTRLVDAWLSCGCQVVGQLLCLTILTGNVINLREIWPLR